MGIDFALRDEIRVTVRERCAGQVAGLGPRLTHQQQDPRRVDGDHGRHFGGDLVGHLVPFAEDDEVGQRGAHHRGFAGLLRLLEEARKAALDLCQGHISL